MSNREDQFMGFARAVVEEITGRDEYDECDMEEIIARAAHDLVEHTHSSILDLVGSWSDPISIMCEDDFVARIPDLPVLPEEKSEC